MPGLREQIAVFRFAEDDREQAVLQRVVAEDVRDLGAEHRAQAEIEQRPRRVLAGGAAAEVASGDEDISQPRAAGLVEFEIAGSGVPSAA